MSSLPETRPSEISTASDSIRSIVDAAAADYLADTSNAGLAIGVVCGEDEQLFGFGLLDKSTGAKVDPDTIFEIGSITKLFTANLLAILAREGRVGLDDPVSKYLPADCAVPRFGEQEITLRHLATHTSSLPRLPDNLDAHVKDPADPYAHYTVQHLEEGLGEIRLTRPIGSYCEYSNLGMGLLGHALARATGSGYESLVVDRLCRPLGMADTTIRLAGEQPARFATGHSSKGEPVPHWSLPALPGAGALRSTGRDMLKYVAANLGYASTAVQPALDECREVAHRIPRRVPTWKAWAGAVALAAASLAAQHFAPVPPGSWTFLLTYILPVGIAARRCGLWPSALCGTILLLGTAILWGEKFDGTTGAFFTILTVYFLGKRAGGGEQRLAWQDSELPGGEQVLWHNGGTGGFCSFLGLLPERRIGIVILSNSENSVDDLGLELLEALREPPAVADAPPDGSATQADR